MKSASETVTELFYNHVHFSDSVDLLRILAKIQKRISGVYEQQLRVAKGTTRRSHIIEAKRSTLGSLKTRFRLR